MRKKSNVPDENKIRFAANSHCKVVDIFKCQKRSSACVTAVHCSNLKKTANPNAPILSIIEGFPVTIKKAGEKGHKRIHDMRVMGFLKRV